MQDGINMLRIRLIKAVQKYLSVAPTGVFTDQLADSLSAFQRNNGLTVSGKITYDTFRLLKKEFYKSNRGVMPLRFDKASLPLKRWDVGHSVHILNDMLREFFRGYSYEGILPMGGIFDERTSGAVNWSRQIIGVVGDDTVDEELILRIYREILLKNKG